MTTTRQQVIYNKIDIEDTGIFYRESGSVNAPVILLLHGFPSSSHMFRNLIPKLAQEYRVIAPDYPGYGYSDQPKLEDFEYSFASLGRIIGKFVEKLDLKKYFIYMQDFGGPVGFRLAVENPDQVAGIIVQNAVIHAEGWNPEVVSKFSPFWESRTVETEKPMREFLSAETTKWQYVHGEERTQNLSPDAWTHDQIALDRPGNDLVQLQYLWNYQENLAQYQKWQDYLRETQPPLLITWGKNDPFFTNAGVEALQNLVPNAEVHLYPAGHFALETHSPEIATEMSKFLGKHSR